MQKRDGLVTAWPTVLGVAIAQTSANRESDMKQHAKGSFEVKLSPQRPDSEMSKAANLGRMTIDKQFRGDLEPTSIELGKHFYADYQIDPAR